MNEKWTSECGTVTLYLGDCLEIMPTLAPGSVDAVVTDPPYGIAHESHGSLFVGHEKIAGDDTTATAEGIRIEASRLGACCVMHYSPYRPLTGFRNVLVWIKGEHVGIGGDRATCWKRDFELIGVERNKKLFGMRESGVITSFPALLPPPSGHAHEKPVGLMRYLIRKICAQCVVDPCMGSGSTGVASVSLHIPFVGIELEPKYFAIAKRRIQDELKKVAFLEPKKPRESQRTLLDA